EGIAQQCKFHFIGLRLERARPPVGSESQRAMLAAIIIDNLVLRVTTVLAMMIAASIALWLSLPTGGRARSKRKPIK
ncbi:MAG: hypothetical protein ACT4QE_04775, partial [Anaerolineales bacterium]